MNNHRFSLQFAHFAQRSRSLVAIATTALLVSACGSDSKSNNSSSSSVSSSSSSHSYSAPSVPDNGTGTWPSVKVSSNQIKSLTFEWSAVPGATYYKLFKRQGGSGGSVQIGGNISGTSAQDDISVHVHDWVNTYYTVVAYNSSNQEIESSEQAFTATEMIKSIGYIKASNTETGDFFWLERCVIGRWPNPRGRRAR